MKFSDLFQASIFFHHAYRNDCMLVKKLLKLVGKKFSCKKVPLEAKYVSTHLVLPNYVLQNFKSMFPLFKGDFLLEPIIHPHLRHKSCSDHCIAKIENQNRFYFLLVANVSKEEHPMTTFSLSATTMSSRSKGSETLTEWKSESVMDGGRCKRCLCI